MNLRARILALILASSLLSALGMLWVLWENRTDAVLRAQSQLTSLTESTAKDLDDRVSGTAQLLFGLSRVPVVSSDDAAACSDFLADVLNEHPQYTGLLTILPEGQLHCDSLRTRQVMNLTDRDYFKGVQRFHASLPEGHGLLRLAVGGAPKWTGAPGSASDEKDRCIMAFGKNPSSLA
jgi:hypothetical protein